MKSWSVYLPNGEAVTVVGEIECRDGKYYFKNGDDVVAVFNEDKVCGVHEVYSPRSKVIHCQCKTCLILKEIMRADKTISLSASSVYPQGDEG